MTSGNDRKHKDGGIDGGVFIHEDIMNNYSRLKALPQVLPYDETEVVIKQDSENQMNE